MLILYILFLLAGIAEIGGGYLVWLYMRDDKSPLYLLAGAIILILYGIIPTFQPGPVWQGLCCIRRRIYCTLHSMGLVLSMDCAPTCTILSAV